MAREDTLQDSTVNLAQMFLILRCLARLVCPKDLEKPCLELFFLTQALLVAVLSEKVIEISFTLARLRCRRLRLKHVTLLKLEEELLVLVKEGLTHLPVPFDEVEQVNDVQVSFQLLLTLSQIELLAFATGLETLIASKCEAAGTRAQQVPHAIAEHGLINDQMVDREHLLLGRHGSYQRFFLKILYLLAQS